MRVGLALHDVTDLLAGRTLDEALWATCMTSQRDDGDGDDGDGDDDDESWPGTARRYRPAGRPDTG